MLDNALMARAGDCVTRLAAFPLGCSSAAFGSSTVHTLCEMAVAVCTVSLLPSRCYEGRMRVSALACIDQRRRPEP